MIRKLLAVVFGLFALAALAQNESGRVQSVGDVAFAVPDGWGYTGGADFGALVFKQDTRFWLTSVYTSMPSTGNPDEDFKAAWRRVVLPLGGFKGVPGYNPYNISKPLGYPGKYYDDYNPTVYVRLYALETGKRCIPVVFISGNRQMLDSMSHIEGAVIGNVRMAPDKAAPLRQSIRIADLVGQWKEGLAFSTSYYSRSTGQYVGSDVTAYGADYNIASNGSYSYKMSGLMNNRPVSDNDTGAIELSGEFLTLNGKLYHNRYRFLYLMQALDGSTVMAAFPDGSNDVKFWTRQPRK